MLATLYSAAAGLEAQQGRLDALANDIANVSTPGYKRLRVGFHDLLYQAAGRGAGARVTTGSGAAAAVIGRNPAQGALIRTEQPLDVALIGAGFIAVRGADGRLALTRDGSLGVAPDGRLRTSTGQLLEPPVRLPRGADLDEVTIGADGTVRVGRRRLGRIRVLTVPNPDGLAPAGESLLRPTAASGAPVAARGTRLEQGALEGSNVDLGEAMVEMIEAQRGFELASRAIQVADDVLGVANGVKR